MYNSGDAAEQVVRMSLEGAEVALKITGAAAKNLAAALYTVLKDQKKTKGKPYSPWRESICASLRYSSSSSLMA